MLGKWLDASSTSNRYQQMYIKGFLDISGGNLIVRHNNLYLQNGDISLNGRLLVNKDASLNGNLTIGKDVIVKGNLYATFAENSIPATSIMGGIPGTTGIYSIDLSLNQRLFVSNDVSFNSQLYVGNNAIFNKDISLNGKLVVNGISQFGNISSGNANMTNLLATNIYENGVLLANKYVPSNSPTFTGTVSGITSSMVGLGNVNNTSDLDKPISTATQNAINGLVSNVSPALSGIPTAPTAAYPTNTTQLATTSYVVTGISGMIGSAPAKLSTLAQIAAAINNDPSYNTTVTSTFARINAPNFLSSITTPKLLVTSDASLNSRLFVNNDSSFNGNLMVGKRIFEGGSSLITKYATLASPTFTGSVTMPNTTMTQDLITMGDISLNSRLFIGGDASFNGDLAVGKSIYSLGDASIKSRFFVSGDTSLNSNVYIGKDLTVNGNLVVKQYTSNMVFYTVSYELIVAEDLSLNGRLFMTGDASLNNSLFIGGDSSLNGNLFVNGNSKIKGNMEVMGELITNTQLNSDSSRLVATTAYVQNQGYAKLNGANFTGDVSMNNLAIIGNLTTNTQANSDSSHLVATTAYVQNQGYAKLNGSEFTGDVSMNNLAIIGELTANTQTTTDSSQLVATTEYVQNNLTSFAINSNFTGETTVDRLSVNNDLSMNGRLMVGTSIYEGGNSLISKYATLESPSFTGTVTIPYNGELHVNSRTIMNNDVSMNKNLDLSGSIIAHSNMNLYGIINQYTVSLEDGYKVNYTNINASGELIANGVKLSTDITGKNTFFGMTAGNAITTGVNNTFIGYGSGSNITSGSNNTVIGNGSQSSSQTVSNEITLGNNTITTLRCNASTITSLSDGRDKTNIEPIPAGLDFITQLNPVAFEWNSRDGSKVGNHEFGFIAQELKSSQETIGINIPNLVYEENPDRLEASYSVLIPIMVKAIQELKELTAKQQIEITDLRNKLNA